MAKTNKQVKPAKIIGTRMLQRMDEIGMPRKVLIADSGIPANSVGNYVRGLSEPTASRLIQIADVLGVSVDWLLDRTDDQKLHHLDNTKGTEMTIPGIIVAPDPCVCGTNGEHVQLDVRISADGVSRYAYCCPNCGASASVATTERSARLLWNTMQASARKPKSYDHYCDRCGVYDPCGQTLRGTDEYYCEICYEDMFA